MNLTVPILTLVAGLVVGYLGQRSGFCTISGMRDFILFRHEYLLKGLIGLFVGALGGFLLFTAIGGDTPDFPNFLAPRYSISILALIIAAIGGLGLGFFSCLAEGCPFHLHVMAGEGHMKAVAYLVGLYAGIVFYYLVISRYVILITTLFG